MIVGRAVNPPAFYGQDYFRVYFSILFAACAPTATSTALSPLD